MGWSEGVGLGMRAGLGTAGLESMVLGSVGLGSVEATVLFLRRGVDLRGAEGGGRRGI